jgi:tagatose 6-phosphate kinase
MILAAGLTPSWQQTLLFEHFRTGQVNRAKQVRWHAAGKAVNVGIALHHLEADCLTLFPAGGPVGESLQRDLDLIGVPHQVIRTETGSRVCTTIVDQDGNQITELVANAAPVTEEILNAFTAAYRKVVKRAEMVILSGSLPPGTPVTFYRDLIALTQCPVILDASGSELVAALSSKPFFIKPNREEIARSLGRALEDQDALKSAIGELHELGAGSVLVSRGALPAIAFLDGHFYEFAPPGIEVLNPIGSGDCLAAGLAVGFAGSMSIVDAVRFGLAAGTANAELLLSARLNLARVHALLPSVTVRLI